MRTNDTIPRHATRTVADRIYHASAVAGALLTPALLVGLMLEVLL